MPSSSRLACLHGVLATGACQLTRHHHHPHLPSPGTRACAPASLIEATYPERAQQLFLPSTCFKLHRFSVKCSRIATPEQLRAPATVASWPAQIIPSVRRARPSRPYQNDSRSPTGSCPCRLKRSLLPRRRLSSVQSSNTQKAHELLKAQHRRRIRKSMAAAKIFRATSRIASSSAPRQKYCKPRSRSRHQPPKAQAKRPLAGRHSDTSTAALKQVTTLMKMKITWTYVLRTTWISVRTT
jgi:hypothetical protein